MNAIEQKDCLPILNWAGEIDEKTLQQATNVAKHPCAVHRVVLAPDAHAGMGVPIGCVLAADRAVIPNAVGVDIGCSMSACRTNIEAASISQELLRQIVGSREGGHTGLYALIPVGKNHHKTPREHPVIDDTGRWEDTVVCREQRDSARYQLGTMGGGNHFIELQADEEGYLWYMIHSGSRNLGHCVGSHYHQVASELCARFRQNDVVERRLSFLPEGTEEYELYVREMQLCMDFARANHEEMQRVLEETLRRFLPDIEFREHIFTRHNYAALEHHDGRDLWVHRKGAVRAMRGTRAIIPGSQGTASYIVEGLGNPASYCSASHGAGRKMSRTQAQRVLTLEGELDRMKGIVHGISVQSQLDEAPSAYKDIDDVLSRESDLVQPRVRLRPLAVMKG